MIHVGTSKIDITPKESLPLVGFGFREGVFEDIHTPLYLKVFVVQSQTTSIFIYGDLIWWGNDTVELFKKQFELDGRYKDTTLIFHASHTHCAPHISNQFADRLGKTSENYQVFVFESLWKAIEDAHKDIEEVNVYRQNGKSAMPINRRLLNETGTISMAPNTQGIIDDDLTIITFETVKDKSLKGFWVNASCHPTCSGDNRISMEFQAMAIEKISQQLGNLVGVYLQGFCGDTRPKLIKDNEFYRGSLSKESEEMSELFYQEIKTVFSSPKEKIEIKDIEYREEEVFLPLDYDFEYSDYKKIINQDDVIGDWARNIKETPLSLPLKVSCWKWGENLQFLLINGEIVTEYSLFAKSICKHVVCLGYSNGMLAYIPTKQQIKEKGYESYDSLFWFNLPAPFDQKIEELLKKTIYSLISKN
jgi:hypothetical protein